MTETRVSYLKRMKPFRRIRETKIKIRVVKILLSNLEKVTSGNRKGEYFFGDVLFL